MMIFELPKKVKISNDTQYNFMVLVKGTVAFPEHIYYYIHLNIYYTP